MKLLFIYIFCVFIIFSTLAHAEVTIEEKVVADVFSKFVIAEAYDDVCNQPKMINDDNKNPVFINYFGNTQMIAARVGGLWMLHNPDATPEQGAQVLFKMKELVKTKALDLLKEKGCRSDVGVAAKKAFDLYTQVHPGILYGLIDKEIVKQGGTVTSPEKLDKSLPKK